MVFQLILDQLKKDNLFLAIKGKNDGNKFIKSSIKKRSWMCCFKFKKKK